MDYFDLSAVLTDPAKKADMTDEMVFVEHLPWT